MMMPHGWCFNWDRELLWVTATGNLAIMLAYYCIPVMVIVLIIRRKVGPIIGTTWFWLLAMFVFACGTTHLMDTIVLWHPIYWVEAMVTWITALISWTAVGVLFPHAKKYVFSKPDTERFMMHRKLEREKDLKELKSVLGEIEERTHGTL